MKLHPLNFVDLPNQERIAYRKAGHKGPSMLLIHGNMSSSVHFHSTMEALKEDYQVYAVDLRGFGKSSYRRPTCSLKDLSDDLVQWMDQLGIQTATVLGWSMGGGVAMELAASIPHRINQLFLVASVGIQGFKTCSTKLLSSAKIPARSALSFNQRRFQKWNPLLQKMESAIKHHDQKLLTKLLETLYHTYQLSPSEMQLYLEAIYEQRNYSDIYYDLLEFNMTNQSNGYHPGSNRYQLIQAPTVILHGRYDKIIDLADSQQTKAYLGDKAKLFLLETGHAIIADDFISFLTILRNEHPIPQT